MTIDKMFLRVAKVQTFAGAGPLTNATGFFFLHDGFLYLITARHVVINEAAGHRPDSLHVSLHTDVADLRQRADLSVPLYVEGVPQWREHPQYRGRVDVVAVAMNDPHVLSGHFVETFDPADIWSPAQALPFGQEVLIVGFPLGFHDTLHNLPIVRSAIVATSFSHPFKGEPCFLTDARMHRGTSGAPIIARLPAAAGTAEPREPSWRLLGIHSSSLDVSDRDPQQDERLALNIGWYASLLPEMLSRSPAAA
ncbi:MAG TPA: trypsin-like peptidase domain-containing protein [Planctomycetaceae bacterium]|nr:trypsin-like peptidase domain-containing protein [Planctomycetaceae bacterium]